MDIQTWLLIVTGIITGASVILKTIAPYTKTKKDDKVLQVLLTILKVLSIHTPEKKVVEVKVSSK